MIPQPKYSLKPGFTLFHHDTKMEVVRNCRSTRPFCIQCDQRCPSSIYYKFGWLGGKTYCSWDCFAGKGKPKLLSTWWISAFLVFLFMSWWTCNTTTSYYLMNLNKLFSQTSENLNGNGIKSNWSWDLIYSWNDPCITRIYVFGLLVFLFFSFFFCYGCK